MEAVLEVATIANRLAAIASCIGTFRKRAKAGTMKTPPPRPTMDPNTPPTKPTTAKRITCVMPSRLPQPFRVRPAAVTGRSRRELLDAAVNNARVLVFFVALAAVATNLRGAHG